MVYIQFMFLFKYNNSMYQHDNYLRRSTSYLGTFGNTHVIFMPPPPPPPATFSKEV